MRKSLRILFAVLILSALVVAIFIGSGCGRGTCEDNSDCVGCEYCGSDDQCHVACPSGQTCCMNTGMCVKSGEPCPACTSHNDCLRFRYCINNVCVNAPPESPSET